jgi:hypothetical protein
MNGTVVPFTGRPQDGLISRQLDARVTVRKGPSAATLKLARKLELLRKMDPRIAAIAEALIDAYVG